MSSFPSLFDCEARADAWINGDIPGRADIRRGNAIGSMTVSAGSASTHQDPLTHQEGPTSNVPSSPMGRRGSSRTEVPVRGTGLGPLQAVPGHHHPDRPAMADLRRAGREHPGRLRVCRAIDSLHKSADVGENRGCDLGSDEKCTPAAPLVAQFTPWPIAPPIYLT